MRKLRAALYNPYLDTLGGGELHILSILKVLEQEECDITIFWDKNLEKEIHNKFHLKFENKLIFKKNIFHQFSSHFERIKSLSQFDYFFYVTDGSYFFSSAKKTFIFSMVPKKSLYQMSFLNKIKTSRFSFIANSLFTAGWLKKWGIRAQVIYPYLDDSFINESIQVKKDNIILSVGRFYSHTHTKNHLALISLFKQYKQHNPLFKDYVLILLGGLKYEDQSYFKQIEKEVGKDPSIVLIPNVAYSKLLSLYQKAKYYWHLAGYEVDDTIHPEQVEHLGIAPVQAMATGCLTLCVNRGGPREIITSGENGFLFDDKKQLFAQMDKVAGNIKLQDLLRKNSRKYIQNNFRYQTFANRVKQVILDK